MKFISLLLKGISFLSIVSVTDAKKKPGPQCSTCKEIVNNFVKGLERTKKSNFGGGNTDWEESRLGQYANSEVRLVEIIEELCGEDTKECPQMLEEHETAVEDFWFKSGLKKDESEFFKYFCIENVKACCPNNTYGPSCADCPGSKERPCKDNGVCQGAGTREGSGKCKCHPGYHGELCDSCSDGYFEAEKNDTHTTCKVCHISCKKTCSGYGQKLCDECKDGWLLDADTGCEDIDECESSPCKGKVYCANTQGSFSCLACNVACDGCTGPGPDKCLKCNKGFKQKGGTCVDIDECSPEWHEELCHYEGEVCENTPGSYKCGCKEGYFKFGIDCKPKPKEEESEVPDKASSDDDSDNTPKPNLSPSEEQSPDRQKEEL